MRASLDTNVIIHFYRAGLKELLFNFFEDGVVIYAQIRDVELENHGGDVLAEVDKDITDSKITKYTDEMLKKQSIYNLFIKNVRDNKILYNPDDMGEVYAISLAQTLGIEYLVTDDIKQGGPYMSLMQLEDYDVRPFNFAEILILLFLSGKESSDSIIGFFDEINKASNLNWSIKSHLERFLRRFVYDPYNVEDVDWFKEYKDKYSIKMKSRIDELYQRISE